MQGNAGTDPVQQSPADLEGEWKRELFVDLLARTGNFLAAAKALGYKDSSYFRRWYKKDKMFRIYCDEAMEAAVDRFEEEAIRRAVDGIEEPVYHQGKIVGYKKRYSDDLLKEILAAKSDDYKKNKGGNINLSPGSYGVAILPVANKSSEDWEKDALESQEQQKKLQSEVIDAEFEDV